MNVHRWRKLEGSDPATYSMIQRAHALQKTLIRKTEEVASKDQLIQEKEKLYVELKAILARQPGPEVAEQLTIYQSNLSEKQKQMKAMTSELAMHREQVSDPSSSRLGSRPTHLPHLPLTPHPHPQVSDLQLEAEALATRKTQIKREYFAHRQRLRRQHQLQLGSIDEGPYGGYTDDAFDGAGPPPDTAGSADSADGGAPPPDGAGLSVDDARPDSADEPPPGSG